MATVITSEALRLVQLALYQLRQDVGVPATPEAEASDTSLFWKKCRTCYDLAFGEVLHAHRWTWAVSSTTDYSTKPDNWPDNAKNALVYTIARELAVPVAGRVEDMKNCAALAAQKLVTARLEDLSGLLSASTDTVLLQLVSNFRADDPGLVRAFEVYTQRSERVKTLCEQAAAEAFGVTVTSASPLTGVPKLAADCMAVAKLAVACGLDANVSNVQIQEYERLLAEYKQKKLATDVDDESSSIYTACLDEVKKTLGATGSGTPDALMKACAKCLCYARNGARYGYDANFIQLKEQEYTAKIVQWRKLTLETARQDDEVLSQLVGSFRGDDAALANAWSAYSGRHVAVKTLCEQAAAEAFGVTGTLTGIPKLAANCMAVAKLSPAFGLEAGFVAAQMQEYDKLLSEYKQKKLATDVDTSSSAIYTDCLAEVKQTLGVTGSGTPDALMIASVKCLCYVRNGARYGYDANFIQLKEQEYTAKIVQWRKLKLESDRQDDAVLSQLVGSFRGDDAALANAWTAYSARANAVKALCDNAAKEAFGVQTLAGIPLEASNCMAVAKLAPAFGLDANFAAAQMQEYDRLLAEYKQKKLADDVDTANSALYVACLDEVKQTLGITGSGTPDALMVACAKCLCYVRNGPRYGYDANFVQLKEQEYAAKIAEWRKVKMNQELQTNSDVVLVQLLSNFKLDDTGLANAFAVYTNRATQVKALAQAEINNAHGWRTAFDHTAQTANQHVAYAAWVALCVAKLAASVGMDANGVQLMEQKYQMALRSARIAELESARSEVTDADDSEVLTIVLKSFASGEQPLPFSFGDVTDRLDAVKETSRMTVLTAHNWAFARDEYETGGCACDPVSDALYQFSTAAPPKCARILACCDARRRESDWKLVGGTVKSVYPVERITYLRDVTDLSRWPATVRAVYRALVAANVAAGVSSVTDANRLAQAYEQALATAKATDSRESGARREVYGRNYYADAMRGDTLFRPRTRRGPWPC